MGSSVMMRNRMIRTLVALGRARSSLSPRPLMMIIEPSARCNARCPFCYHWQEGWDGQNLRTERWLHLIDEARDLGCIAVNVSGGEPTLLPDLGAMLGRVREAGMSSHITTNGFRTDVLSNIAHLLDSATISLDFADRAHDETRCLPGLFDAAVRSIHLLRTRRVEVRVNMTLGADNKGQMDAVHSLVAGLGGLLHVRLMTREARLEGIKPLSVVEVGQAGEQLRRIKQLPGSVLVTPDSYLTSMLNGPSFRCRLLSLLLQVDWAGRVYVPCPKYEHEKLRIAGNITQMSLRDVWHSREAIELRTESMSCTPGLDCMSACVHDISALAGWQPDMLWEQLASRTSLGRLLAGRLFK